MTLNPSSLSPRGLLGLTLFLSASAMSCSEGEGFVQLSPPLLLVNVDQLDFGDVPVGFSVTRRVTLTNGGDIDLNLQSASAGGVFAVASEVMIIEPGTDVELRLTFAPNAATTFEDELIILSDASNAPDKRLPLRGTGVPPVSCGNCTSPPPTTCLSVDDQVSYAETGTCVMNECEYTATVTACAQGCDTATGRCRGEAADAGVAPDAEPTDSGELRDTGTPDTGVQPDTGLPDSGTVPDAGPSCADAGITDSGLGAPSAAFTTPGAYTATLPAGTTTVLVRAWGGGGQGGNQNAATGGGGAFVQAELTVAGGESLDILVGEGGGPSGLGNGAGASYVQRAGTDLVVAAGGGGGGSDGNSGRSMAGGAGGGGGGPSGEPGGHGIGNIATFCTQVTGGTGGTQSAPGVGGTSQGTAANRCNGQPGARNVGGRATGASGNCDTTPGADGWRSGGGQGNGGGGGGGAGYFGGGGSGFIWTYCGAGGGGGASWADLNASNTVYEGGQGSLQGRASQSGGAGRGGERCESGTPCTCTPGAPGRVELYY